jgi:hypothetical protein
MTPLQDQLTRLRDTADKATPGPWEFERQSWESGEFSYEINTGNRLLAVYESNYKNPMRAKFDSAHIAAFSPARRTCPD